MRARCAFTLIEILVVLTVLGVLAAMTIPRLVGRSDRARVKIAQFEISSVIPSALKMYETDNGAFPTTEQGLEALRTRPTRDPVPQSWNGPYLDHDPTDPWGRPYIYVSPGDQNPDYDLSSRGEDIHSAKDFISNW